MTTETTPDYRARQEARNALFAAAVEAPQRNDYASYAEYTAAFNAYQANVMQALRDNLAAS